MLKKPGLSRYRQRIYQCVKSIEHLATRCLSIDPLIQGSPAEVFRTCGRAGCKCLTDNSQRHGPYKVIQIVREGRSRQICLKRNDEDLWLLAKQYQVQSASLLELKKKCCDLAELVSEVIQQRSVELPFDDIKQNR